MEEKKNSGNGCIIGFVVILGIIILIPFIMSLIDSKKSLEAEKLESKLLRDGKVVSAKTIADNFAKDLKDKNYKEMYKYFASDCKFYNNDGQQKNLESCFEGIEEISTYSIEARGDTSKTDRKTYRILCNGTTYENTNQIIMLNMQKKVKKEEITYEIYIVKFTDNTPLY